MAEGKPFKGYNPKKHSRSGGLNDAYREKLNRETGSNLKRPVTGSPKPGTEAAGRKKSFCARMSGVKGPTREGGELTPKGAALKRWNCADGGMIGDNMPLKEGKSKKAFESNIKTEIEAGKPPKQAVAIAYAVKRRNMASGGLAKKGKEYEREGREVGNPIAVWGGKKMQAGHESLSYNKARTPEIPYSQEFANKIDDSYAETRGKASEAAEKAYEKSVEKSHAENRKKYGLAEGGTVKHVEQKDTHCEHCGQKMAYGGMAEGGGVIEKKAMGLGQPHSEVAKLAEGGTVQNQKLHPSHQVAKDPRLVHQTAAMRMGHSQSEVGKLAHGGSVVDEIMKNRKKMAEGGEVEEESERDHEDWFADREDFSNVHYMEDDEHEVDPNPSDDDYSLVGQIIKERKRNRPK